MADILIRGMEMPATCWNCKLKVGFSACGLVTDHKDGGLFYRVHKGNSRPYWCPLLPLPKGHGRLIDADALERVCKEMADDEWNKKAAPYSWEYAYNQFIDDEIFNAPTIVPAEGWTE